MNLFSKNPRKLAVSLVSFINFVKSQVISHSINFKSSHESHNLNQESRDIIRIFLIQFNVPFKIISLIETSQSIGGAKREYPGKTI